MGVMRFTAAVAGLGDTQFSAPMSDEKEKMYASQASTVTKSFSHSCAGKPQHLGKILCNPQKKMVMCNRELFFFLQSWPCKISAHQFLFPSEWCNCQTDLKKQSAVKLAGTDGQRSADDTAD